MKQIFAALLVTIIAAHSAHCLPSQEPKRVMRQFNMDDAVIIRELGAVITSKEEKLTVDIILGNNEKQSSDIMKDDLILMANGKKVKSIKDLREQYDGAKAGEEFKIGLKRGENLMIAKFTKKSPEELNKEGHGQMVITMDGNDGDKVLPALGLIITSKGKNAVVKGTLPNAEKNFTSFLPKENDVILSINGAKVSSAEEFDEAYTELNAGDKVTIEFSRDGKNSKESFSKPKPMGRMIMRK